MSSSSGNSQPLNSTGSSDEDLQQIMDIRKRKRMQSNRESARRSRMRKQKHLDDMMAQANQLREENNQILTSLNLTTQLLMSVEAENSVLKAQMAELSHRLKSLNDIVACLNGSNNNNSSTVNNTFLDDDHHQQTMEDDDDAFVNEMMMLNGGLMMGDFDFLNPWNLLNVNQPILASSDVFMY